jgi:hypothetical protein
MSTLQAAERPVGRRSWLVPAALVALSAIPLTAGALRLIQLAGGGGIAPDVRFKDPPAPIVVHVVSAAVYALLGAFQFARRFRRQHAAGRTAGRSAVVTGGPSTYEIRALFASSRARPTRATVLILGEVTLSSC